jgi:squalene-hopene/tetraprenyl-beta-curcumene cyclase
VTLAQLQPRLRAALDRATAELLAARSPDGHWTGELSSSALSTATAVTALAVVQRESRITNRESQITSGLAWLAAHQNADGGWGDTVFSLSNLSTTTLCWAAFGAVPGADGQFRDAVTKAEAWIAKHAAGLTPEQLAPAIITRYGKDRTFSVPILTMCALAGRLGAGREAWRHVIALPFELAACPHSWFAALRLPVVSYALPALIAIGQARHHHSPSRNPVARLARNFTRELTLRKLQSIQPTNGGFLEATPLTSFVTMSLAGSGQAEHPVAKRGVDFLLASQRPDGSWPIDTNLATWVTTLAANAIADSGSPMADCSGDAPPSAIGNPESAIRSWLLNQQYRTVHPYTHAAPGGWAWTDLPGGVPDADDTAGALLALRKLGPIDDATREAAFAGITWLLDLQNRDGGIPTFCRGWGALPFDQSSADITAHATRAWLAWFDGVSPNLQSRILGGLERALAFLTRVQKPDGSWLPLWFGNQHTPDDHNPTYGTARVLISLCEAIEFGFTRNIQKSLRVAFKRAYEAEAKAELWLIGSQRGPQTGWGGGRHGAASVEETALVVEALATLSGRAAPRSGNSIRSQIAAVSGAEWLLTRVESGEWTQPSPIGLYFAKLWYYEKLYPMIFTVGALTAALRTAPSAPR